MKKRSLRPQTHCPRPHHHGIELLVDRLVPAMLFLLLLLIAGNVFFKEQMEHHEQYVEIADAAIILVFAADLYFKWRRVHEVKPFLKRYWLDIIAIIPFYLVFRLFEGAFLTAAETIRGVSEGQRILHEGLEYERLEQQGAKVAKEIEGVRAVRMTRVARFIRVAQRFPRLLKAVHFFEKPWRKK